MENKQEENEISIVFDCKTTDELEKKLNEDTLNFSSLLDSLEDVDEKQKLLWKQIYDNAIEDRKNAYLVWTDLYIKVHGDEEKHFKHGATIAKYMERMEKANEQILKLAVLIDKAKIKSEDGFLSPNEIFEKSEKKFKTNKYLK
jgi:hypothetical protein